jgi:hypothetical protein
VPRGRARTPAGNPATTTIIARVTRGYPSRGATGAAVASGQPLATDDIQAVLVRLPWVREHDLYRIDAADRAYAAAEMSARRASGTRSAPRCVTATRPERSPASTASDVQRRSGSIGMVATHLTQLSKRGDLANASWAGIRVGRGLSAPRRRRNRDQQRPAGLGECRRADRRVSRPRHMVLALARARGREAQRLGARRDRALADHADAEAARRLGRRREPALQAQLHLVGLAVGLGDRAGERAVG